MASLLIAIIYVSFISLGLPDAILGAAWPTMYPELNAPISGAGLIFMIIATGTVVSALLGDGLIRRFGTAKLTLFSAFITAISILGFSTSRTYVQLCMFAVPYGLGAGAVDSALNNYVALHYSSRHMSWLHCMWGIGATTGPYIMGLVLSGGGNWPTGYRLIFVIQLCIAALLFLSLPLWKNNKSGNNTDNATAMTLVDVVCIPGVKEIMLAFFCYCALEQTSGLWASSYLVLYKAVDENTAAFFGSIFFLGITAGRAVNGFLAARFNDKELIKGGMILIGSGVAALVLPFGKTVSLIGFILIGFGCAPIYPCIIHSTPFYFGSDRSQAVIGVEMAAAYIGNIIMPPLFGFLAERVSISLMPFYLLLILLIMWYMYSLMLKKCEK